MRKTFFLLSVVALAGVFVSGCANVEGKLGRGFRNSYEIVRGGEMSRSLEQTALFESPDMAYTTGFVRGFDRTMARTGLGLYEIVTSPFPPYHPVLTKYLTAQPVYPDNYTPDVVEDSVFATDTYVGYAGGDTAPWIPGSRFEIFETH